MKSKWFSLVLSVSSLTWAGALRAEVLVTTDTSLNAYVVHASGVNGYTATVDRTDGHLRSLAVGDAEMFTDQPLPPWADWMGPRPGLLGFSATQIGFMGVLAAGKAAIALTIPATVAMPVRDGDSVVLHVTAGNDLALTYRFEPQRLGISASGKSDLVLNWAPHGVDYHVGNRVVYGQADSEILDAASFEAHPFGTEGNVLAISTSQGKMTLSSYADMPLGTAPIWIAARDIFAGRQSAGASNSPCFASTMAMSPRFRRRISWTMQFTTACLSIQDNRFQRHSSRSAQIQSARA